MSKSILEKALLEAEQLEETMKSNAKEILSSTMKEEIYDLVKESLSEEDDYLKEQEDEEQEVDTEIDIESDVMSDEDLDLGDELDIEDETEDEESLELPPLDLTLASDEEVIKVFKSMGDEDGIVIQQDGDEISLTDGDEEYLIKLEENKMKRNSKINETEDMETLELDMGSEDNEMDDDMMEMEDEDVVYEIELDDDEAPDDELMEDEPYGGNKGDERRSAKRDYMETDKYGGNKGDERRSAKRDYMEMGEYGGNKGDLKRSAKKDYMEMEDSYGGNKGDIRRSAKRDYMEDQPYGGNKGDIRRSAKKDYTEGRQNSMTQKARAGQRSNSYNQKARGHSGIHLPESYNRLKQEVTGLKNKNSEYKKALVSFKQKLNETAVFNSNLAYATRLFTEHSTTKTEKLNILRRFDNVKSLKESKGLYKVIRESLTGNTTKKNISESVERKIAKTPSSGANTKLMESKVYENPQFSRIKDLMSKL
tara:strand:+ start:1752 stop:3191 length:1440 start_codon:yes stop_codon:yes gene_type:complete